MDEDDDLEAGYQEDYDDDNKELLSWHDTTTHLAILAAIPVTIVQLPRIIDNSFLLLAGAPLQEIPWKIQVGNTIGILSMLSFFTSSRERCGAWVQICCLILAAILHFQMAIAGDMPLGALKTIALALVMAASQECIPINIWAVWEDALCLTVTASLTEVLILSTTFLQGCYPTTVTWCITMLVIILARMGKIPSTLPSLISAWSASFLCFYTSILQMRFKTASTTQIVLTMLGNGLQLPRALFMRDLLWFSTAAVGVLAQGWSILLIEYMKSSTSHTFFWGITWSLGIWTSKILRKDAKAYKLSSPFQPILELLSTE